MDVREFVKKVKNKEVNVVEHVKDVIDKCKKINEEFNYFNVISDDHTLSDAKKVNDNPAGKLAGVVVSVKDCICVKDIESRAGSKVLQGYKPVFDATVIKKLRDEGAIIIGKTSQDEFGFGSFNLNVGKGFKIPLNPYDKERVTGGSSGGSAGVTRKLKELGIPHISIAESTGGSIACPAAFCGVIGLTPTYGRVSRYGLIDYGNSLDKIGSMAGNVYEAALLLEVIAGHDEKDSTSVDLPVDNYTSYVGSDVKGMKIGVIKESFDDVVSPDVQNAVKSVIDLLKNNGVIVEEVTLPLAFNYGVETYYLIAMSEASTNLAKYCGMRYGAYSELKGNFNEYFAKVRSDNFGKEAKRRVMVGTFARMAGYRDAYYIKAQKVRTLIINEYKKLFEHYDALISPTMPFIAPKITEAEKLTPLQNYMADKMLSAPNLAGLPHINVPFFNSDGMPLGILIIGDHFKEGKIIQIASAIESALNQEM